MITPDKPEVQVILMTTFMITSQPDGFKAGQSQTKGWTKNTFNSWQEKASKWPKENIKRKQLWPKTQ